MTSKRFYSQIDRKKGEERIEKQKVMRYINLEVHMASVLIIDDDEGVRAVAEHSLEMGGHTAYAAENASRAIDILNEYTIDIALVDIVMPERGGIDLMMEMHNEFPDIKIIVMSGKIDIDSDAFKLLSRQFGALHILSKPFTPEMLLGSVDGVMDFI